MRFFYLPGANNNASGIKNESGYALVEIIAGMALMMVMTVSVVLSYTEFRDAFERKAAADQLVTDIRRARSEAAAYGARVIFQIDVDGAGYSLGIDRFPYSVTQTPDFALVASPLPEYITLQAPSLIMFDSRGTLIDSSGFRVTRSMTVKQDGSSIGTATILPTGKVTIDLS